MKLWRKKIARETVFAARRGERVDARMEVRERMRVARSRRGRDQFYCGCVVSTRIPYAWVVSSNVFVYSISFMLGQTAQVETYKRI